MTGGGGMRYRSSRSLKRIEAANNKVKELPQSILSDKQLKILMEKFGIVTKVKQ